MRFIPVAYRIINKRKNKVIHEIEKLRAEN